MGKSRFTAVVGQNEITIRYDGREVLYWTMDEWIEDPSVALAAAEAIRMAYAQPGALFEKLKKLGKV